VGETEFRHRTKWIIGLTLYPDKSYLEATVKLFNRTPFVHSMLYWTNVAVHASEDYQIIFPPSTECTTFHGKNQFSHWPISTEIFNRVDYSRGVDISWYKNHKAPTSFFAWNSEEDFLAGYDHGKEAGVAYVADHYIAPGKKFWTWGTGTQGQMWEKILTDTDGPYLELMVGAYSDNQPDYSWIQPYETREVKQYWFPLRKIQGVKKANLEAAVNLEVTPGGKAQIGINTTSGNEGAKVVLEAKGDVLFVRLIDIAPDAPYFEEVKLPSQVEEEHLRLILYSPSGKELIRYVPVKRKTKALPEAVEPPPPPEEIETVEELYHAGLRLEQFHNPAMEAYPYYEEALNRDPNNSLVNIALAILYLKRGMFSSAEQKLNRALSRTTQNYTRPKEGEVFYYLGIALRAQNRHKEAYDAFNKAAWSFAWRASSYYCLAEIDCARGDYAKALDFLDRSLALNQLNLRACNLKACLLRKMGEMEEALKITKKVLHLDPLNFWAVNEQFLQMTGKGLESQAEECLNMLMERMRDAVQNHHFHVWEGGGRIHSVYVDAHLLRGQRYILSKDYERALENYLEALEYPENLEVGRPVRGGGEPRVFYFIGTAYEAMGERDQAKECFEQSVSVKTGWSELSFYQGLSLKKLGRQDEAQQILEGLMEFAQKRVQASEGMDFFAKFGERQTASARRAQAHYLLGLSYLEKGEKEKARAEFERACQLNVNHLWAKHYLSTIKIQ